MKTIKQIADDLGIDKQRVYRFIQKNHIVASSELKQSKLYDEASEAFIKSHFNHIATSNDRYSKAPKSPNRSDSMADQFIKLLQAKDMQIEKLQQQVEELSSENKRLSEKLFTLSDQIGNALQSISQVHMADRLLERKVMLDTEAATSVPPEKKKRFWPWRR